MCSQFIWNEFYNYKACEFCMRPLETTEENVQRLTNNPKFKLPYNEYCAIDKTTIRKCEKCQVEYCCQECRVNAWQTYHEVLCLGDSKHNPEHPINVLLDTWRYLNAQSG